MKKIAHLKDANNTRGRIEMKVLQKLKNQGLLEGKSPYEIKQIICSMLDERDPSEPSDNDSNEESKASLIDEVIGVKERIKTLDTKLDEAVELSKTILESFRMSTSSLRNPPLRHNTNRPHLRILEISGESQSEQEDIAGISRSELGTVDTSFKYQY
jgi:hypothetical protein